MQLPQVHTAPRCRECLPAVNEGTSVDQSMRRRSQHGTECTLLVCHREATSAGQSDLAHSMGHVTLPAIL